MTEFNPNEIMLQNYIQNKLSETETEQLELWLADHPDVMQELELDLMFKQADFDPNEQLQQTKSFKLWNFFSSKKLIPINVLAYGLALFFVVSLYKTNEVSNGVSVNPNVSIFRIATTRSNNSQLLSLDNLDNVIIVLEMDDIKTKVYKVSMFKNDGEIIQEIDNLKPKNQYMNQGDLIFPLKQNLLIFGEINFVVSEQNSNKSLITFSTKFDVQKP